MSREIRQGDCIEEMAKLDESSVDAVVCDPPYYLTFMGRAWDHAPSPVESQRQHLAWATEALRILKPGGHLLAFGGTRTYHRLACAVEDAGFEIRDSVIWLYGSGFPKSLDVSKAIDKAAGAQREVVGTYTMPADSTAPGYEASGEAGYDGGHGIDRSVTAPATPEAEQWQGWGTALKPAHEIVVCGRKPDPAGEWTKIHGSLCELRAKLLSLSLAKPAASSSSSRPVEPDDPDLLATARWTADERSNTRDALCEAMGTSQFESALTSSLSIASSWSDTLDALLTAESTSTTETASGTTTDLKTLRSCLSDLTPRIMLQAATSPDGSSLSALPAVAAFNAVASRLNATQTLSALASATSRDQASSQDGAAPSHEPIVVARKPLVGTVAQNVQEHGTGALNVDGCRIGYQGEADKRLETRGVHVGGAYQHPAGDSFKKAENAVAPAHDAGRWPANTILSHLPECEQVGTRKVKNRGGVPDSESEKGSTPAFTSDERTSTVHHFDPDGTETVLAWKCVPDCPVRVLDEQSGDRKSNGGRVADSGMFAMRAQPEIDTGYGDSGGASRFYYTAKASRSERNAGLEGFEERPLPMGGHGNGEGDPISVEMGSQRKARNSHPTVKPIALMRWLCRLVTPPGGLILDPFTGSGTTGCAAVLEGFDFLGIEREAEYVEIAKARVAHWAAQPVQLGFEAA